MNYEVRELGKAQADIQAIAEWLFQRSPTGALEWLNAYDQMVTRLKQQAEVFGMALEASELTLEVRQALFKTPRGRVYRALFHIDGHII